MKKGEKHSLKWLFIMIYTVTFNPSLDYVIKVTNLKLGQINRTQAEALFAGGKGINVSIVLKHLGIESVCLGFIAGFVGEQIEEKLNSLGCKTDFIKLENGLSRINVKMRSNVETEVNGQGPIVSRRDLNKLFLKLGKLQKGDVLVLAGSVPTSLPANVYKNILKNLDGKGIQVVADAGNDLLTNLLKYKPFLLKPNKKELEEIFGTQITSKDQVIKYAKKLQNSGARNVLVSLSSDGALLVTEEGKIFESGVPKGVVVNSVGSGDSMVAGFLAGYLNYEDYSKAFKMGLASGSASAFSENLATGEEILELLSKM
jgi:1-phosphofructokinase